MPSKSRLMKACSLQFVEKIIDVPRRRKKRRGGFIQEKTYLVIFEFKLRSCYFDEDTLAGVDKGAGSHTEPLGWIKIGHPQIHEDERRFIEPWPTNQHESARIIFIGFQFPVSNSMFDVRCSMFDVPSVSIRVYPWLKTLCFCRFELRDCYFGKCTLTGVYGRKRKRRRAMRPVRASKPV